VQTQQPILVYSPEYNTDLNRFGVAKPFALDRGQRVLEALGQDLGAPVPYLVPKPISKADLLLVHTAAYLETLNSPATWAEIFELKDDEYNPDGAERPLNEMLGDIRLKCGGTLLAAELALKQGLSANLGGGYHHAFPDQGRGFCSLNDIAIAVRSLQKRSLCRNVLIVDLDFHQGDGTALIFSGDPTVYTLSVHSQEGWPEEKQVSTLDVPVQEDEVASYQQKVEEAIEKALSTFAADLCLYVAGSDPYELDVLPGTKFIKLSLAEMRKRDEFVIDTFADRRIPLAMVFAGGYGPNVWEVHYFATRRLLERASRLKPSAIRR